MSSTKKYFIHYCCVSISEGLNTELCTTELMLGKYDKKGYQKCKFCYCVIEIKKAFKEEKDVCKKCLELLEMKIELTLQFILFGQIIKSIKFLQTFIVHFKDLCATQCNNYCLVVMLLTP